MQSILQLLGLFYLDFPGQIWHNNTMKKVYIILREHVFLAIGKGQLPQDCFVEAGSLWCYVALTDTERTAYTYPIELLC